MTVSLHGADVAALRDLRTSLTAFAAEIDRCAVTTSVTLDQLAWAGHDRNWFREAWELEHRPALARVAEVVALAAEEIEEHADEQEVVSSAPGGGGAAVATADGGHGTVRLATPPGQAAQGPTRSGDPAAPEGPVEEHDLGSLSRRYESNGNPGMVSTGRGDHGGVSYGTYQFSSTMGSAQEFVDGLRDTHPEYHAALDGLTPGTEEFSTAWREIAADDPEGFREAQHDAIRRTHYEPQLRATEARIPGLDFEERSAALRDVLWSTSVQHRGTTDDIFERAIGGRDVTAMTDAEIIRAVYAERGRDDGNAYFGRSNVNVRAGVVNRFRQEERDALAMLGE